MDDLPSIDAPSIAAVVIGRNEQTRLSLALASVLRARLPTIYVDSDSSDDSVMISSALGVRTERLRAPPLLCAARARNAGFSALEEAGIAREYVMFLDGDCVLAENFPAHASAAMEKDADVAIVVGHLIEESAGGSIYERLSAHEWSSAAGEIKDFNNLGGIMLVRSKAFAAAGGFNPQMIAGEDPEFAVRLALRGWRTIKIDAEMASHANGIDRFGQWWRRSVRAGHAMTDRYARNGRSLIKDCRRQLASTLFWGFGLPAVALVFAIPTRGWSLALLLAYGLLCFRMFRSARRSGRSAGDARWTAWFGLLAKFANLWGVLQYVRRRLSGKFELIEYKRVQSSSQTR